ncbi:MAG: 30S ribosomal protein S20 [Alphaproteobacteria bacterium]|nr:30S ribosomal protein S20 [Alphaproteobacteria bacterium]
MATHESAKKRARQTLTKSARNTARVSRIRSFIRQAIEANAGDDKAAAETAFKTAMSELHRGVTKGVINKNTASRKISRLNASLKAKPASTAR